MSKQVDPWSGWDIIEDDGPSLTWGFFLDGLLRGKVVESIRPRGLRYISCRITLEGKETYKETFDNLPPGPGVGLPLVY